MYIIKATAIVLTAMWTHATAKLSLVKHVQSDPHSSIASHSHREDPEAQQLIDHLESHIFEP
jgi:hypothetical protein